MAEALPKIEEKSAAEMNSEGPKIKEELTVEPALPSHKSSETRVLYIDKIPEKYPWDEFSQFLSNFGSVQYCEKGPLRESTYCALATYGNREQDQHVLQQLDKYEIINGAVLEVGFCVDRTGSINIGRQAGSCPVGNPGASNDFPLRNGGPSSKSSKSSSSKKRLKENLLELIDEIHDQALKNLKRLHDDLESGHEKVRKLLKKE